MMQNRRVTTDSWLNLFALDVLIVLMVVLIIYMTITPISEHVAVPVNLPESTAAQRSPEYEYEPTVTVNNDAIFVNHLAVRFVGLDQALRPADCVPAAICACESHATSRLAPCAE